MSIPATILFYAVLNVASDSDSFIVAITARAIAPVRIPTDIAQTHVAAYVKRLAIAASHNYSVVLAGSRRQSNLGRAGTDSRVEANSGIHFGSGNVTVPRYCRSRGANFSRF